MNLRKLGIGTVVATVFAAGLTAGIGSAGWLDADQKAQGLKAALGATAEVPKPAAVRKGVGGTFTGSLTRRTGGGTLTWRLTFRNLTGRAVAAHVHLARPGVAGPVAVPLCGPCRTGARGTARVNARAVTALLGGGAYVNVHTGRNPAGEIRCQVRKSANALPAPTGTGTTSTQPPTEPPPYDPYP